MRIRIWLVGLILIVMGFVPPWRYVTEQGTSVQAEAAGYSPLVWPPAPLIRTQKFESVSDALAAEQVRESDPEAYRRLFQRQYSAQVDVERLLLQWFLVGVFAAVWTFAGPFSVTVRSMRRVALWLWISILLATAGAIVWNLAEAAGAATDIQGTINSLTAIGVALAWTAAIVYRAQSELVMRIGVYCAGALGMLSLFAAAEPRPTIGGRMVAVITALGISALWWVYALTLKKRHYPVGVGFFILLLVGLEALSNGLPPWILVIWSYLLWLTIYLHRHEQSTRFVDSGDLKSDPVETELI
jgi:hypothetical protein